MWQWCFLRSAWWKKTFQIIYQKLALFYIVWEIQILAVFMLVFLNESDATCGSDAVIALRWILHKLLVNYALEVLVFIFCPLNAAIILNNTWYNSHCINSLQKLWSISSWEKSGSKYWNMAAHLHELTILGICYDG